MNKVHYKGIPCKSGSQWKSTVLTSNGNMNSVTCKRCLAWLTKWRNFDKSISKNDLNPLVMNKNEIAEALGHKDVQTTDQYVKQLAEEQASSTTDQQEPDNQKPEDQS